MDDENEKPRVNKRIVREISGYWGVIAAACTIYFVPQVLILSLLPQSTTKKTPGILRPEAGQAVVTNIKTALAPENIVLLAAERLNGKIAAQVLNCPSQMPMLQTSDSTKIGGILLRNPEVDDAEQVTKDLEIAHKGGAVWDPAAGPWGLFLLPSDRQPPRTDKPFGLVEMTSGVEIARINCEGLLNRKLFELSKIKGWTTLARPNTVWELLQAACAEGLLAPKEAIRNLAIAQMLGIEYLPEKKLFLSRQTVLKWKMVNKTMENLPAELTDN